MAQQIINVKGLEHPEGSPIACRIGPLLATGPINGKNPETGILPESVDEQAKNCFANLKRVLAAGGMGLDDVAKLTMFVKRDEDGAVMRKHWAVAFPDPNRRPVRRTLEAKIHASDVQVEVIAYKAP